MLIFKKILIIAFLVLASQSILAADLLRLTQFQTSLPSRPITLSARLASVQSDAELKETSRSLDFNQTLHIRVQQEYQGYKVWGADAVIHLPKAQHLMKQSFFDITQLKIQKLAMNGFIYNHIRNDLPSHTFNIASEAGLEKALASTSRLLQQTLHQTYAVLHQNITPIVFVGEDHKAHWAYLINFLIKAAKSIQKPTYIVDAASLKIYQQWDDLKTSGLRVDVPGGGFGGNIKMGKIVYDGLPNHAPALKMQRHSLLEHCYLNNSEVVVQDVRKKNAVEQYICTGPNALHHSIFWNDFLDPVNGAYSPGNDALFIGQTIQQLFHDWYGIPPLMKNRKPMKLIMRVHEDIANASWEDGVMTFGDGDDELYPLVSLGVGAHEIAHGFTEQHANLIYINQSGGLNESFSDMAAAAAEFFVKGENTWRIGEEVMKAPNQVIRYMDHPSDHCQMVINENTHLEEEVCSIEHIRDYKPGLDVHLSSGIFNRAFYLIATAPEWNTRKAFDVMVKANMHYWTSYATFTHAACGVLSATRDYGYPEGAIISAFSDVGIDLTSC